MSQQFTIDFTRGEDLRDEGIERAITHADYASEGWSELAYAFLKKYIESHSIFMAEDVRQAASGIVPLPPSNRAWGGIMVRAAHENLIYRCGFRNVKNARAHCTPAALWAAQSINEKVA